MTSTYTVTIDPTRQLGKPPKSKINVIHNNLNIVTGLTINEMLTYTTSPYSYTISPAIFNGARENNNWLSQHSFWLDFDSGITPEIAKEKLKHYGIEPNIIYYTFSHTVDSPRFRLIILLDQPITDSTIAKSIRENLIECLGADRACKDSARIFLGGTTGEIHTETPNTINQLVQFAGIQEVAKDNLQTRNLQKFSSFYNITNRSDQDSAIPPYQHIDPRLEYLNSHKQNKFNYDLAIEKLQILKDFTSGKELKYLQLIGLATNLIHVNGGFKFMREHMEKFNAQGKTKYKSEDFAILRESKFNEYYPQRLEKFSPYIEDHVYTDIIDAVKKPRGEVQIIDPKIKIELSEAEALFDLEFQRIIQSKSNDIFILKTQTAIGKSTRLTQQKKTTLAFPTHKLKEEISNKMRVDHHLVPDLPIFKDSRINDRITIYYSAGLNDDVYMLLNSVAYIMNADYCEDDRKLARTYLEAISNSYTTKKTVLTTHIRALYDQYSHNTVVFDEDPLESLLTIEKFNFADLLILEQSINEKEPISKLIDLIRTAKPGIIYTIDQLEIDRHRIAELVSENKFSSNLIQFFGAISFCKDKQNPCIIHYQIKRSIPSNKKVIIMSATPQIEVYKALYGDRVKVVDIPMAESQGEIIQHTKNGYSRSYLKNNDISDLVEHIGERRVITFQNYKKLFPTANPTVHFQNCEGYDFLNGIDLAVVGTPHKNELYYFFTAHAIGIDLSQVNLKLQDLKIDWKGFRFRFTTYEDERLRNIQLEAIEAELVQAVGRSRSLRTDAQVIVYSNLPLQICSKIMP
jgi:hypothetical protein